MFRLSVTAVSQPPLKSVLLRPQTISKALGELESELGVTLFERRGKRIAATSDALLVAEKAENVLANLDDLVRLARHVREQTDGKPERVSVAVASSPLRGCLVPPRLFDRFAIKYPNVEITFVRNGSESCLNAVQQGLVDAAVTLGRTTRDCLSWTRVYTFTFHVLVCSDHPLAAHKVASIKDIAQYRVATPQDFRCSFRLVKEQFAMHGIAPTFTDVSPTKEDHGAFIASGGVLFVSGDVSLEQTYYGSKLLPLAEADSLSLPICFMYREDNKNPAVMALQQELLIAGRELKNKA